METGPIPWQHIWYYCKELELDDEQTDDMLYFVRSLDGHQLGGQKVARDKKAAKDKSAQATKQRQTRHSR